MKKQGGHKVFKKTTKTVVTKKKHAGFKTVQKKNPDIIEKFVIDTSGSMLKDCGGQSRLAAVRDSLRDTLKAFQKRKRRGDRIEIVAFGSRRQTVLTPTCPRDIKDVDAIIASVKTGKATGELINFSDREREEDSYLVDVAF